MAGMVSDGEIDEISTYRFLFINKEQDIFKMSPRANVLGGPNIIVEIDKNHLFTGKNNLEMFYF